MDFWSKEDNLMCWRGMDAELASKRGITEGSVRKHRHDLRKKFRSLRELKES